MPRTIMNTITNTIASIIAVLTIGLGSAALARQSIDWRTVDTGGGAVGGGSLALEGTIAQPDPGTMTGGTLALNGGFWSVMSTAPPCPGDTDGSGSVDIDDIVNVVLDFGTDGSANGGDVDSSGAVDIDDVVLVVLNFGSCPGT